MESAHLSALLLDWYRLAAEAPPQGFRPAALTLLEAVVPFDSAWWGTANPQAGQVSVMQGHLHRLPVAFLEDWWSIADTDSLALRCAEQPGVTVLDDGQAPGTPQEDAFDARYDLVCALSTVLPDESTGLYGFLSLFRGARSPVFSAQERAQVELLVPHLVLAEQWHWRLGLARQIGAADELQAQVDEAGFLLQATPDFCQLLLREFPAWPGGPLPEPLRALTAGALENADSSPWQGRQFEARARSLAPADRAQPTARWRMALRPRIGHKLSPREETIARAYAAGDSYKEIARQLGLSPATVRGYLRECYLKLGVSNKSALGGVLRGGAG